MQDFSLEYFRRSIAEFGGSVGKLWAWVKPLSYLRLDISPLQINRMNVALFLFENNFLGWISISLSLWLVSWLVSSMCAWPGALLICHVQDFSIQKFNSTCKLKFFSRWLLEYACSKLSIKHNHLQIVKVVGAVAAASVAILYSVRERDGCKKIT